MSDLLEAANEICGFMGARKWSFCLIGGLAVQKWGEPRLDQAYILVQLADLCELKDAPETFARAKQILEKKS